MGRITGSVSRDSDKTVTTKMPFWARLPFNTSLAFSEITLLAKSSLASLTCQLKPLFDCFRSRASLLSLGKWCCHIPFLILSKSVYTTLVSAAHLRSNHFSPPTSRSPCLVPLCHPPILVYFPVLLSVRLNCLVKHTRPSHVIFFHRTFNCDFLQSTLRLDALYLLACRIRFHSNEGE